MQDLPRFERRRPRFPGASKWVASYAPIELLFRTYGVVIHLKPHMQQGLTLYIWGCIHVFIQKFTVYWAA